MKTSLRTLLKYGKASVAMSFLIGSGQVLAQQAATTQPGAVTAASATVAPLDMTAAIARAQAKMQRAQAIVNQYAHRASIEGITSDGWRVELMTNLLLGTDEGFDRAANAGTLAKALQTAQQSVSDRRQAGRQPTMNKLIGSTTFDLTFIPATPCRIVDTRSAGGPFGNGEVRTYSFRGGAGQGGSVGCDPYFQSQYHQAAFPAAMAINVGAIAFGLGGSPTVSGFVSVFPQGGSGNTAFLNFWGNDIISNAGVVGLNQTNGQFSVLAQFPTQITVDYFGSFVVPEATALDCVTTAENSAVMNLSTTVADPAFYNFASAPACQAGYTETATQCRTEFVNDWVSSSFAGGTCYGNTNNNTHHVFAARRCCRIPGDPL